MTTCGTVRTFIVVAHLFAACAMLASATFWCDERESEDPYFVSNVKTVVERMATLTAVHPELDYITEDAGPMENGAPKWTVYGKAKCKVSDSSTCQSCLYDGWRDMVYDCYYRFGAQYFTDQCSMRYELYSDFGLQ